ncbi:hypothetical protein HMPREF9999_00895 [Alloprevotella sp. oral taxon 473 str. F0040]|nr:hypothetical protein HMPREF9999_00895 [Alloprevotella sp. oral taxon 473 str. F0040]
MSCLNLSLFNTGEKVKTSYEKTCKSAAMSEEMSTFANCYIASFCLIY